MFLRKAILNPLRASLTYMRPVAYVPIKCFATPKKAASGDLNTANLAGMMAGVSGGNKRINT